MGEAAAPPITGYKKSASNGQERQNHSMVIKNE
jgi:hypothetical protein